ncbi:ABC transporter permease [Umezawaea sp.]|uniref:ABC transporter permease n=1 Tax=Umezawaea sp. TaxID=1955258 RepID=UPI002ED4F328
MTELLAEPRPLAVVRHASLNALADLRATYTPTSWTVGWLGRMLAQVAFFTVVGHLIGSAEHTRYLVIGNSLMTCVIEVMMVVASTTWERRAGTLPLLVAAPAELGLVFVGRSLQWTISGSGTSLVSLLVLAPLFGVHWTVGQFLTVVPLVLLTAFSTYAFGLVLAAAVLGTTGLRNITSNAAYLVMMAVCGVQVPVSYWPGAVQLAAECLPLTHGLRAVRAVADAEPLGTVLSRALPAAVAGACWLALALAVFRLTAARARRTGSVVYS